MPLVLLISNMKDSWLYAKGTIISSLKEWKLFAEKHGQFVKSGKYFTTRWQHCLLPALGFFALQSSLILPMCYKNRGNKASGIRWFGEVVTSGRLVCWTSYFMSVKDYSFCKDTDKIGFSLRNVFSFHCFSQSDSDKEGKGGSFQSGHLRFSFTTWFFWNQGSNIILRQLRIWPQNVFSYKGSRLD